LTLLYHPVRVNDRARDGETQTNASSLSASRNFQPDEWIKNAVLVLCRNTGAIIVDFDANSRRCC
jgi:hypothetical protein